MKFVLHYAIEPFPSGRGFSFCFRKLLFAVVRREPIRDWSDEKYGEHFLLASGGWSKSAYTSDISTAYPFEKRIAQSIVKELNKLLPEKGSPHA